MHYRSNVKKWCIDLNDDKLLFCPSELKAIKDIRECVNKIADILNEYFKKWQDAALLSVLIQGI